MLNSSGTVRRGEQLFSELQKTSLKITSLAAQNKERSHIHALRLTFLATPTLLFHVFCGTLCLLGEAPAAFLKPHQDQPGQHQTYPWATSLALTVGTPFPAHTTALIKLQGTSLNLKALLPNWLKAQLLQSCEK